MYEVVWPRGRSTVASAPLARRLDTLSGKTIGELWNTVFRGDKIFPVLEEELSRRFPGVKFVRYETFGPTHGPDEARAVEELPGKLKEHACDAVISGVGC